MREKSKVEPV